ncbi:unnamed protein product [Rotaria sp. Silwood1]|nr:unnamed protein product [Rotaria sp. Silwood1]
MYFIARMIFCPPAWIWSLDLRMFVADIAKQSPWRRRTAINFGLGIFGIVNQIASSFDVYADIGGRNLDRAGELMIPQVTTTPIENDSEK